MGITPSIVLYAMHTQSRPPHKNCGAYPWGCKKVNGKSRDFHMEKIEIISCKTFIWNLFYRRHRFIVAKRLRNHKKFFPDQWFSGKRQKNMEKVTQIYRKKIAEQKVYNDFLAKGRRSHLYFKIYTIS